MINIYLAVIALALVFAFVREVKGPTASDRIVALDNLTIIITAGLVLLAYYYDRFIYVDVSIIYGILSFIGVLTLARYMEGGL